MAASLFEILRWTTSVDTGLIEMLHTHLDLPSGDGLQPIVAHTNLILAGYGECCDTKVADH